MLQLSYCFNFFPNSLSFCLLFRFCWQSPFFTLLVSFFCASCTHVVELTGGSLSPGKTSILGSTASEFTLLQPASAQHYYITNANANNTSASISNATATSPSYPGKLPLFFSFTSIHIHLLFLITFLHSILSFFKPFLFRLLPPFLSFSLSYSLALLFYQYSLLRFPFSSWWWSWLWL